jgi:hypothetical protein
LHAAASTKKEATQGGESYLSWGLWRAEDVRSVALEALAKVTVVGVGCERKKKMLQRREKG